MSSPLPSKLTTNILKLTRTVTAEAVKTGALNSVAKQALTATFTLQKRTIELQSAVFAFVGLPSANDLERLQRRVRSLMRRLEQIEDDLDRNAITPAELAALKKELTGIKKQLATKSASSAVASAKAKNTA